MARKKLYGAAAAAHAKKVARKGGKSRRSTAITHTSRTVHVHHKARRRRRHGGGGGPMKLTHLALATGALAFITKAGGAKDDFSTKINEAMANVPGTKTFGATAMLGIGALAVDRFIKPNKWLKLLGTAGIVLAAAQVGSKGSDFKFLGDNDVGDYDLADDLGDDDLGDDDIGDDE